MRKRAWLIICLIIVSSLVAVLMNNNNSNNSISIQPEDGRIENGKYIYKYQIQFPSGTEEANFHIYTWEDGWKNAGTRRVVINGRKTLEIFFYRSDADLILSTAPDTIEVNDFFPERTMMVSTLNYPLTVKANHEINLISAVAAEKSSDLSIDTHDVSNISGLTNGSLLSISIMTEN